MQFVTADNHPQEDIDAAAAWLHIHEYDLPAIVGHRKGDSPQIMLKEIGYCPPPPHWVPCDPLQFVLCRERGIHVDATPSTWADPVRVASLPEQTECYEGRLEEGFEYNCIGESERTPSRTILSRTGEVLHVDFSQRRLDPQKRRPLANVKQFERIGPARTEEQAREYLSDLNSYLNLRPGIYTPGACPRPPAQPTRTPGFWWEWRPWRWLKRESPERKPFVDWKWRGRKGAFVMCGSRLFDRCTLPRRVREGEGSAPAPLIYLADAGVHRARRHVQCDGHATDMRYTRPSHVRYMWGLFGDRGAQLTMYYRQDKNLVELRSTQRRHDTEDVMFAPWMKSLIQRKDYEDELPVESFSTKRAQGWMRRGISSHPPHHDLIRVEAEELVPLAYTDPGWPGLVSSLWLLGRTVDEISDRLGIPVRNVRAFLSDWSNWVSIPAAEIKASLQPTQKRKLSRKIKVVLRPSSNQKLSAQECEGPQRT